MIPAGPSDLRNNFQTLVTTTSRSWLFHNGPSGRFCTICNYSHHPQTLLPKEKGERRIQIGISNSKAAS
jgi:hypothetical protein